LNTREKGARHERIVADWFRKENYSVEVAPRMRFRKDFFGCVDLICLPRVYGSLMVLAQVKTNASRPELLKVQRELAALGSGYFVFLVVNFKRLKEGWVIEWFYKRACDGTTEWREHVFNRDTFTQIGQTVIREL
jgi:hypothetical protein